MKETKKYYIAKRLNPTLPKPFYVGLGELTQTEANNKKPLGMGTIELELCEDKQDYDKKLNDYRNQGLCLF